MHAELISLAEAEEACGIPRRTLRRWAIDGGARVRFHEGRLWASRRGLIRCLQERGLPLPAAWERRPRILIADDDAELRQVVRWELERQWPEAEIRTAADGGQAWAMARESPPDLLVTDLRMPEMDGMLLAQNIGRCAELGRTKVLTMTAFDDCETRMECFDCGADEFLKKPFEPCELRQAALRLLGAGAFPREGSCHGAR